MAEEVIKNLILIIGLSKDGKEFNDVFRKHHLIIMYESLLAPTPKSEKKAVKKETFPKLTVRKPVIQRKVGMEFQSMSGGKDVTSTSIANHRVILKDMPDHKITMDMGDYEYVIPPVDERKNTEITNLKAACDSAGNSHRNILKKLTPNNVIMNPKTNKPFKNKRNYLFGTDVFQIKKPKNNTAHPQATAGIKLEKVSTFMTTLQQRMSCNTTAPFQVNPKSITELNISNGGSKSSFASPQMEVFKRINPIGLDHYGLTESGFGIAKVLASMVQSLQLFDPEKVHNAKTPMPIMPRTSLLDVFRRLPAADQTIFKNLADTPQKRLLTFIVGKEGTITSPIAAAAGLTPLTLKEWIDSLPAPGAPPSPDLMYDRKYGGIAELSDTNPTAGWKTKFHVNRSTDIGYDTAVPQGAAGASANQVEGMLLEIRNLNRGVESEDWGNIARDIALLVRISNTGTIKES